MKPDFKKSSLLPAICQHAVTGEVLMLAWTDEEAYTRTHRDQQVWFFSRSRQQYWLKGETSGNLLHLVETQVDCDNDTLLYLVLPAGPACHKNVRTCWVENDQQRRPFLAGTWSDLSDTIVERAKSGNSSKSYVASLLNGGVEKCNAKVMEEASELVEAASNEADENVANEAADLLFHMMVLLQARGLNWQDVANVLRRREGLSGIEEKRQRATQGNPD